MENMKFKTNIKCAACVATVTPYLDKTAGENNWLVDTASPEKILTVTPDNRLSESSVVTSLQQAGYKAERIS